ncbi:MAG: ABC transporter ATP-binding protein [Kaiparowitsia implicata GSE-PSE-MK54-09C]|jgi:lipopolysaccharide transport system ATP-binding protein|nr:ABC transporter ATP-binding protein [Kaiparowitsia implicata GSE-PSE-MK54-09C]
MRDAIIVQNLGKRFNRYHTHKPVTFMEAMISGLRNVRPVDNFWALRHVSFSVAPGEMLGIVGHNGAGKSTLLQLVGGVGSPNEGKVRVHGRLGALLDLGAGFHGDLTGRENALVTTIVAGLTERAAKRRLDQIVAFAELEDFIDNPVRTYSTGMQMRLAFAVAVHTEPDVLLVDEFLSVGDIAFQAKCLDRIAQLKSQGCAIVLISHDAGQVQRLCDRALWLKQGKVNAYGEPDVIAGQYVSEMRSHTQQLTPNRPPQLAASGLELQVNQNRFGSLEAEITAVQLNPHATITSGDALAVDIEYQTEQSIPSPIFSVSISNEAGELCLDTNTLDLNGPTGMIQGTGKLVLNIERLDLAPGSYFVDVGIYEQSWSYAYDYHWRVYPLVVQAARPVKGVLAPPMQWNLRQLASLPR